MGRVCVYTREEISDSLIRFYEEYGRVPTANDFRDNPLYVNYNTIHKKFGIWNNALKTVGLDPDTLIKKGIRVQNSSHKGRHFELYVGESFEKIYENLSGKNCKSPFDGICPNGMPYEAKSSSFSGVAWDYHFYNSEKEKIRWYYLGAFDRYYTKLLHVWRVPVEIIIGDRLYIGLNPSSKFNVENMRQYEITDKFLEALDKKNITW